MGVIGTVAGPVHAGLVPNIKQCQVNKTISLQTFCLKTSCALLEKKVLALECRNVYSPSRKLRLPRGNKFERAFGSCENISKCRN